MIPEDSLKVFGRAGLLAHSFMLGPNGDSNGCVSFKNYDAFLQAYLDHKIKRLAVWQVCNESATLSLIMTKPEVHSGTFGRRFEYLSTDARSVWKFFHTI
jgi:hypothetical protein